MSDAQIFNESINFISFRRPQIKALNTIEYEQTSNEYSC